MTAAILAVIWAGGAMVTWHVCQALLLDGKEDDSTLPVAAIMSMFWFIVWPGILWTAILRLPEEVRKRRRQ